jgi:hypothetical protein
MFTFEVTAAVNVGINIYPVRVGTGIGRKPKTAYANAIASMGNPRIALVLATKVIDPYGKTKIYH